MLRLVESFQHAQERDGADPAAKPYADVMHNNEEDAQLVSRLLARDESAFRILVSTYHGSMTRLARTIVGSASAEEVVQEAWLKAIGALSGFEGRSSLRQWLLRIVRNEAISRLRKEAHHPPSESLDDDVLANRYTDEGGWKTPPSAWSLDTPEALVAANETRKVIETALAALPPAQRSVFTLRDIEGLSFDEICNILELSASNVRVLLHRARRYLWAVLDGHRKD